MTGVIPPGKTPVICLGMTAALEVDHLIPGTIPTQGDCGHTVAMGPSTLSMVQQGALDFYVCCAQCFDLDPLAPGPDEATAVVAPGAIAEIQRAVPTHVADQVMAMMRDHHIEELDPTDG